MVVLVVDLDPVTEFKVRDEVLAAHGLTGFGATKLQHPAVDRRAVEIMIKADHAKRFGSRDVQRVGDQRDRGVVDVAELLLQIVQDWQRGAGRVALTVDQRLRQERSKAVRPDTTSSRDLYKDALRRGSGSN